VAIGLASTSFIVIFLGSLFNAALGVKKMSRDIDGKTQGSTKSPADSVVSASAEETFANAESTDTPPQSVEKSSDQEVERLTLELSEMKERYLRTVAEMDNMRKRLEREKSDFLKYSSEVIMKDMIPVLDSLDKAIPADAKGTASVTAYREGILIVQKQFLQALAKHGLEPVEAVDKPFDPNLHQAIQRLESSEIEAETVATEFAKGYTLHGRLVRPSMVSVRVPV
jgi:molecular chaperone GrpE